MRTSFLACLLVCFTCPLFAQSDSSSVSKKQAKYFNSFLAGGLLGQSEQGSSLSISTTHGIRFKRLAVGVGVEFDSYLDWKTLPVFGSMSFDFAKIKENAFFIQLNAGYANAWDIKREEEWLVYDLSGGRMISSMVGYRIAARQFSLYILAGHKFQQVHYSYNPMPSSSVPGSTISIEENINRFVLQIGFGLR